MELKQLFTFAAACSLALSVSAQDRVHYTAQSCLTLPIMTDNYHLW